MTALAPILEAFFTERLMTQRGASPHTIASYRDTFTLLLGHIQQAPASPRPAGPGRPGRREISAFLEQLETTRGNTASTRNARLAAIRSLFRYASLRAPEHAALIQQVLAIPAKRFSKQLITFLTEAETGALLAACDLSRWEGRRDRALLLVAAQTGLRLSELTGLNGDVTLGTGGQRPLPGQGPQTPGRPAHNAHPGGAARLDDRTRRAARPAAVPHPHRTAPQRRRRPAPGPPARCCRRPALSVHPAGQACTPTSCGTAAP